MAMAKAGKDTSGQFWHSPGMMEIKSYMDRLAIDSQARARGETREGSERADTVTRRTTVEGGGS